MVNVAPLVTQPIAQPIGEKRLLFHSLTWQRYQTRRATLCRDRGTSPKFLITGTSTPRGYYIQILMSAQCQR